MEAVIIVLLLALLALAGGAVWLLMQRRPAQDPAADRLEQQQQEQERQEQQRAEMRQVLNAIQDTVLTQMNSSEARVNKRLDAVQSSVGQSLTATTETIGKIGEQLGGLSEAAKRIQDVGQDVASLRDVLQPPKLRGIFGELMLEQLLAQVLPAASYTMQHRFNDGTIVDAVIRTPDGLVPVDSKFPIDSYRRLHEATNDDDRERLRRECVRDARKRVEEVAKYIHPGEDTMDFALMYIPAETIFYELLSGTNLSESTTFALERQVHIVSPNTFYMLLQTLSRTLQRMRVQDDVKKFMGQVAHVRKDFERFQAEFVTLGKHINNAKTKYEDLGSWSGKIEGGLRLAAPDAGEDGADALPEHSAAQPALPESVPVNGSDESA